MFKWVNDILILKPLFTFIQRFECVKRYENGRQWEDTGAWDCRSHVNWGAIISILTSLTGFIHPLFLLSYILAFHLYCPLMEDVIQNFKEKDKPNWNVSGQKWERGISFLAFLPLPIIVLVLGLTGVRIL